LSQTSLSSIAVEATATNAFTVVPKTGLAPGATAYTETVTVSNSVNGIVESFTVSFVVKPGATSITLSKTVGGAALDETHDLTCTQAVDGYGAQTALSVTVRNTGDQPTENLTASADSSNFTITPSGTGAISGIAVGGTSAFTVSPIEGLGVGTHTAELTVSGANISSVSFTVSFTVAAKTYSITLKNSSSTLSAYTFAASGPPLYYSAPGALSVTVANTGNQPTGALTASVDSSNFTISPAGGAISSIGAGTSSANAFTVQPATLGLDEGTYTAIVTVSGGNGISKSFTVSWTVGLWTDAGWTPDYPAWPEDSAVIDPFDPVPTPVYPTPTHTISNGDGTGIVTITYTGDTEYTVENAGDLDGTYTLATEGISFASGFTRQILVDGANGTTQRTPAVTITLGGVTISANPPIALQNGANVVLVLADGTTNKLTAGSTYGGLQVRPNSKITIVGSGMLSASANSGMGIGSARTGGYGRISIGDNAKVQATCGDGVGIGGYSPAGTISIGGNAQIMAYGGPGNAGIGGYPGCTIFIGGNARVFARGGTYYAAGIGGNGSSGTITITITGGVVIAITGGQSTNPSAAIGAGSAGSPAGKINISGGFVVAQSYGTTTPDIGAGMDKTGDWDPDTNSVTITGGSVYTAKGMIHPPPRNANGQAVYPLYVPSTLGNFKTISVPSGYATKTIGKTAARFFATYYWTPAGTAQFPTTGVSLPSYPRAVSATLWLPAATYTGITTTPSTDNYSANVTAALVPYTSAGANRLLR
jgi:hypothetical protein